MSPVKISVVLCALAGPAMAAPLKVAVFPFTIVDTSGAPADGQAQRLAVATGELAQSLAATGRYQPVDMAPFAAQIAALQPADECGTCWAELARKTGADVYVLPSVHKVSVLISSMTFWLGDVHSLRYVAHVSGQIRGDTAEAYQRGIEFLVTKELSKTWPLGAAQK